VLVDRVRASDNVADPGVVQRLERAPVDLALLRGDPEVPVRQRFSFFG
jgi:hypothetical protein